MISTGRPSSPPLALMSSRQSSIAACSILPAGAPAPVSASDMPTLIGSAACAGAAASSSTAAQRRADAQRHSSQLHHLILPVAELHYFFRASAYG